MPKGNVTTRKMKSRPAAGLKAAKTEVDALLAADAAWLKAYQAKNAAAAAAFYDKDGAMLTPNRPRLTGKDALRKFIAKSFTLQDYDIAWRPNKAEIARSGELGYTSGSYEMSFRPPRGRLFFDKGKYLMIWKKQATGAWKVLFDISNSDLPPTSRQ